MNRELLEKYIEEGLSSWAVAEKENIGQTTVRYWAKKYGLRFIKRAVPKNYCSRCKITKTAGDFYQYDGARTTYCKPCLSAWTGDRARKLKALAIEYAGGRCVSCGYDRYQGALEFHHRDPAEKDFSIAQNMRRSTLSDTMKTEIDKCVLLCANCHRETHGGIQDWRLLEESNLGPSIPR